MVTYLPPPLSLSLFQFCIFMNLSCFDGQTNKVHEFTLAGHEQITIECITKAPLPYISKGLEKKYYVKL